MSEKDILKEAKAFLVKELSTWKAKEVLGTDDAYSMGKLNAYLEILMMLEKLPTQTENN